MLRYQTTVKTPVGLTDTCGPRGLPVVRGEESRDGYHYYPSREQVGYWMEEGMLVVVAEDYSPGDGYGYLHLLTRAGSG